MSQLSIALFVLSGAFAWFLVGAVFVGCVCIKLGDNFWFFALLIYGTVSLSLLGWLLR